MKIRVSTVRFKLQKYGTVCLFKARQSLTVANQTLTLAGHTTLTQSLFNLKTFTPLTIKILLT